MRDGETEVARDGPSDREWGAIRNHLKESAELFRKMADVMEEVDAADFDIDDFLERRARVGVLFDHSNKHAARIMAIYGLTSAQARLLQYLHLHVGEPVPGPALGGVSAIWEWARRTRELDVEHGWKIDVKSAGSTYNYTLMTVRRDEAAAARWHLLNRIRHSGGTSQERMLALLQEVHPDAVHRADLDYVAQIPSGDRLKRDLHDAGLRVLDTEDDESIEPDYYRLDIAKPSRRPPGRR
jgi:hypothetical protein